MTNETKKYEGNRMGVGYTLYDTGSHNVVILGHGMGSNRHSFTINTLAERLASSGVSSIAMDCQDTNEVLPIQTLVDRYAIARDDVFGTSLTGLASLMAANKIRSRKAGLRAPLIYFADMLDKKLGSEGIAKWQSTGYIEKNGNKMPYEFYKQWRETDVDKVAEQLAQNQIQVGIIQGDKDEMVPYQFSQKFARTAISKGTKVDLRMIEGADHSFTANPQTAQDYIINFLAEGR